jgi:hypothetical protein
MRRSCSSASLGIGSMSGEGKRDDANPAPVTAPFLNSTPTFCGCSGDVAINRRAGA